jgi:hypothetical protein
MREQIIKASYVTTKTDEKMLRTFARRLEQLFIQNTVSIKP